MPQTSALCPPNDQPGRISIPKCKRIEHRTLLALKLRIGNGAQKTTRGHNYFFVAGAASVGLISAGTGSVGGPQGRLGSAGLDTSRRSPPPKSPSPELPSPLLRGRPRGRQNELPADSPSENIPHGTSRSRSPAQALLSRRSPAPPRFLSDAEVWLPSLSPGLLALFSFSPLGLRDFRSPGISVADR
jgi:hypothetical protein